LEVVRIACAAVEVVQIGISLGLCRKHLHDNPKFAIAHDCLAYAYWGERMYPQVIEEWKAYGRLSGHSCDSELAAALEEGYIFAGWKGALTKAIEFRESQRKNGYSSALIIARLYAHMEEKDQAFHWLNVAYQEHDWLLIGLSTYFQLDPLRSDPRFADLARKVGLPQ
jgi:hypothetical protein